MIQTLRRVLDFFTIVAGVAVVLAAIRLQQFGPFYAVMIIALVVFCILPSFILRKDKDLSLRGTLVVFGFLLALMVGISTLGLIASALIAVPIVLSISAAVAGRVMPFVLLGFTMCAIVFIGYLFVTGQRQAPDLSAVAWNMNSKNWFVSGVALFFVCLVNILLVQSLRHFWLVSSLGADKAYRQFEVLVETAPHAILIFDTDSRQYIRCNVMAEELFGYPRDVITGHIRVEDLLPEWQPSGEDSMAYAADGIQAALDNGEHQFEITILTSDGTEVPCEVSMGRLPEEGRNLIRANLINISHRKAGLAMERNLRDQLTASQRMEAIGKLTGGVAHDFNNLLAVIMGNLELLQEDLGNETGSALIQPCIDATRRGADLTRSMLSYAGKAPLKPVLTDLNALVDQTQALAGRTLPSNIEIVTNLCSTLRPVKIDPSAADSALLNLLINAKDAMPEGGKITLQTKNIFLDSGDQDHLNMQLSKGNYVEVSVTDNGTGIDQESLEKAFEPFFTTKPVGEGSGLGLPMVSGFMRQSGGSIVVSSQMGQGTTFKLYFPTAQEVAEQPATLAQPVPLPSHQGARILMAEDERAVAKVLQTMLTKAGYQVHTTPSGDAAFAKYKADGGFDLLLTDMIMPGALQGAGLAQALRDQDPDLPVIFMTGYASEPNRKSDRMSPEEIRLLKPIHRETLLGTVAKALDKADRSLPVQVNSPAERVKS